MPASPSEPTAAAPTVSQPTASQPTVSELIASDGVPLAVTVRESTAGADAPTLVCVHGYPDDQQVWDGIATALADRYRVVTYDVRGAGRSGAPATREGYRLDQLAADLDLVLDTVSPDRPAHLLAHDWGSIQTWHAVTGAGTASRVASYTSVSGPCLDHAALWFRGRAVPGSGPGRRRDRARQSVASVYIGLFQLPRLPELLWRSGLGRKLSASLARVGAKGTATVQPAAPRDLVNGLELYRANMLRSLRDPGARSTAVPVQVLTPTGDPFVTAPLQRAAGFGAADLVVRPVRGGHWVVRDRPAEIAELVDGFVRSVAARAAS